MAELSGKLPKPLEGVRVLEIGGMGPTPFAGMLLADMGAEVLRVERPGGLGVFPGDARQDLLNRGKQSVALDLKSPAAVAAVLALVERADILIEGGRPGVVERLGIGPDECHRRNPPLVYGRMTGWGQDGPLAHTAGHDIGYIAVTGALHAIGDAGGPPQIPLNLIGDFGGGSTYLVMGVLAALTEARLHGRGRVVDAAIVDGAAHLMAAIHAFVNTGTWADERGVNMLDGGAPYYGIYETSDSKHMAVGAIEPKFYAVLLEGLGLSIEMSEQNDRSTWPQTRAVIATAFASRTQRQWTEVFDGTDACVSPVVSILDAAHHPHMKTRGSVVLENGVVQPAPAPRFSGTAPTIGSPPPQIGEHTEAVLARWGVDPTPLIAGGVAVQS